MNRLEKIKILDELFFNLETHIWFTEDTSEQINDIIIEELDGTTRKQNRLKYEIERGNISKKDFELISNDAFFS